MREANQRMFTRVLQAFGDEVEVGSGELFGVAIRFMDQGSPELARSLLAHAFDMHEEENSYIDGEKTHAQIFLELFRRAFYDEETAGYHGTKHIAESPPHLGAITAFLIERALSGTEEEDDNSNNVVIFPGSKSLN